MESLSNRSDGSNSSQTILNRLQKSIRKIEHQSIHSHKSSMTCQITSDTLKIPDLRKTGLADFLDMPRKEKKHYHTSYAKVPLLSFSRNFKPKMMNSVLSGFSFSLFADNHFLTSSKQLFNLPKATFLCVRWTYSCVSSVIVETNSGMILNYFAEESHIQGKEHY